MKPRIAPKLVQEIRKRYQAGETAAALAFALGIHISTIYGYTQDIRAVQRKQRRMDVVRRVVVDKEAVEAVAADLGINPSTVHTWVKDLQGNFEVPKQSAPRQPGIFEGSQSLAETNIQLRSQVKQLTEEREQMAERLKRMRANLDASWQQRDALKQKLNQIRNLTNGL